MIHFNSDANNVYISPGICVARLTYRSVHSGSNIKLLIVIVNFIGMHHIELIYSMSQSGICKKGPLNKRYLSNGERTEYTKWFKS